METDGFKYARCRTDDIWDAELGFGEFEQLP
jgi:hypothetical protein